MRNTAVAITGLVIALVVPGCGGDDESSTEASSNPITKEEFLVQGNEICAAGNAEIEAAAQTTFAGGRPSNSELEAFATETLVPSIETQVNALRELEVPAGEEDQVSEILDAADDALAEATADPLSLTGERDPFADVNELATAYGLAECGA